MPKSNAGSSRASSTTKSTREDNDDESTTTTDNEIDDFDDLIVEEEERIKALQLQAGLQPATPRTPAAASSASPHSIKRTPSQAAISSPQQGTAAGNFFSKIFKLEKKPQMTEEEKLNQKMQQKLIEQALARKQQKQIKLNKEDFLHKATLIWSSKVLPSWNHRDPKLVRQLLYKWGLPPKLRGEIWQVSIGNALNITPEYFEILRKQENKESPAAAIKIDLLRTFPALQFFQEGGPMYDSFKDILECYVKLRPDVGYVQGMSYLVAMLLLNMDTFNAFSSLANMLNATHFYYFFKMNTEEIDRQVYIITWLLKEINPVLSKHFTTIGMNVSMFVMDWFITLFSKSLPLDIATRIWDLYLIEGEVILYRATIGILNYFEHKLLKLDFEQCMYYLSHLNQYLNLHLIEDSGGRHNSSIVSGEMMVFLVEEVDEVRFFETINNTKVTPGKLQRAKDYATRMLKQKKI